uniref:Uncharacterized protein n=1 Tax=Eucampia antarctica TaxID=49252 RepID=A0A7S2W5A6_9STRA|mmetsp:Transcript_205/g.213  ORF Transcript_205/g.213 Transcript_205/m.213 type:complete len:377 (+) Transcript_205:55-1185(+)|eukprot:CAMPEP_0197836818 /NCGR_PEP_ID=MMETSP1437-20131217/30128_1 /TAXON_ID=49252 ORGANISM="Eucampia antarctica, Strain CCMP1452" /NCGR_SAMPLE_ID=MMETSP1437 /ASSEMBLY_ACC=CAM_ASM_001096 /LENGTH=376 /DNA_ID=CAMNT_0043443303 /DNA_START=50 /DNA_END=1180 /DNA_ORIENTATION=-
MWPRIAGLYNVLLCVTAVIVVLPFTSNLNSVEAFGGCSPLATKQRSFVTRLNNNARPKGCAAQPLEKKKVVVFGAGGYLGAVIFGFIQRASSLYGTGLLGGSSSPRAMGATGITLQELNRVLIREFKLAFAGEDLCRLNNMQDVEHIQARLKGMNAAVIGTVYQLETRSVSGNTYEKSPNDKTLEFYLDYKYAANPTEANDDLETHLTLFQNTVDACKLAGLEKLVVIETPQTPKTKRFSDILESAQIPFTYIHASGEHVRTSPYSFESGIQSKDLVITKNLLKSGDWIDYLWEQRASKKKSTTPNTIAREDIAAVVVQSLLSLDWKTNCSLEISSNGDKNEEDAVAKTKRSTKPVKTDRDWCVGVSVVAQKLSSN